MKDLFAQIALAIIIVLATFSQSCGGVQGVSGQSRSAEQEKDVKATLRKLHQEQEGIQEDDAYVYSTKCWISAMENIATEFATDGARDQLKNHCSQSSVADSDTQSQVAVSSNCTCVKLVFPKEQCK